MPLWAVEGDENSHEAGGLIAENPRTVYINGIAVIEHSDPANPDLLCPVGAVHCNPETAEGSPNVFVYGNPVHRIGDDRVCGAVTVATNQLTVFVN